jgi:endonuclease III
VLLRVGYGRANSKNYGAQYRSIQEAIAKELPKQAAQLARAHLLLRQHGKEICRNTGPRCEECPVSSMCGYYSHG